MNRILSVFLFIVFFVGCTDDDHTVVTKQDRTIFVYMAGENSLSSYTGSNLTSIIKGAQNAQIERCNLLVYIDSRSGSPKLYKIEENEQGVVDSVLIKTYPEQNSADKAIMYSVITDVFSTYDTEEKGLFLWSHGTAWLPSDFNNYLRSFGQDGTNHMEINELKEALPNGLDYIIFDACYMASVEVVYELKEKSKYIIGSSVEILADGFPYWLTIPDLLSDKSLEERLTASCESFFNYYNSQSDYYQTGNISLVKTAGLNNLAASCRSLFSGNYIEEKMVDPSEYGLKLQALEYLTSPFGYSFLYDFDSYMSLFDKTSTIDLSSVVMYKNTTVAAYFDAPRTAKPINTYSGLSIYVPQVKNPKMNEWYRRLDWYKAVYE